MPAAVPEVAACNGRDQHPEFSVVIPTYNRAELLPRAIGSVLRQHHTDFELIVVDDGSTDATVEALEAIGDHRVHWFRQDNSGRTAARNAGARAANGTYLTFVDSDDEVLPNWLEDFRRGFRQDEGVGIVCTGYVRQEQGGEKSHVMPQRLGPLFGAPDHRGLFRAQSFAVRRELFLEVGGYAEDLAFSENTELALRLVPHCLEAGWELVSLSTVGAVYHVARPRTPSLAALQRNLDASEYMLRRHRDRLDREPRVHALYLGIAAVRAARVGDFHKSRNFSKRALRIEPWSWRHLGRLLLASLPPLGRRVWRIESHPPAGTAPGSAP